MQWQFSTKFIGFLSFNKRITVDLKIFKQWAELIFILVF